MNLLINFINTAATLLTLLIMARVLLSWFPDVRGGRLVPVIAWVYKMTNPLLLPLQTRLPSFGGLDFSPFILLLGIQFLKRLLIQMILQISR